MSDYQFEESRQLLRSFESSLGRFQMHARRPAILDEVDLKRWKLMEKATGRAAEPDSLAPGLFDNTILQGIHSHCIRLVPEHADRLRGVAIGQCSILGPNACLLRSPAACAIAINTDLMAFLFFANALLLALYRGVKLGSRRRKKGEKQVMRVLAAYAVLTGTAPGDERDTIANHLFVASPREYELSKSIVEAQLLFTALHEVGHLVDPASLGGRWESMSDSGLERYRPHHEGEFRADSFATATMFDESSIPLIEECLPAFTDSGVFSRDDLGHSIVSLFPFFDAMHAWRSTESATASTHPPPLERGRRVLDMLAQLPSFNVEELQLHFDSLISLKHAFDVSA